MQLLLRGWLLPAPTPVKGYLVKGSLSAGDELYMLELSNTGSFLGSRAIHFIGPSNETVFHSWHSLRHVKTKIWYNL